MKLKVTTLYLNLKSHKKQIKSENIKGCSKKVPQANLSQVVPSTVALMLCHQQAITEGNRRDQISTKYQMEHK